ncbi:hypothetical protein [Facilibium subflavum]|uniref:hypothetical protein n=1 Tax=Facilibium subflavum TaxID=2219058 RepID=UPI000E6489D1|nr:hypothetical protein [Facilibium subflavum]
MRIFVLLGLIFLAVIGAYADTSSDSSNYSTDSNTNNTGNNTSNNNASNNQFVQEINKKTTKGLKVFDKLLKDDGQSKEDFFADIGSNPTSGQFEGQDDGQGGPVKNPFAGIVGDENK